MTANKLILLFFLILIASCKNSSSNFTSEIVERLNHTNSFLLELLVSNKNDIELNNDQVKLLRETFKTTNEIVEEDIENQFELLLDNISKIDKDYFLLKYPNSNNKLEYLNKFSSYAKEDLVKQMSIELNKFLEYLVRKSDFDTYESEKEIFLTVVPQSFKVKPNEKFKAEVILAKKYKSLKGKLKLNGNTYLSRMKNGAYHFAETNTLKSDFGERNLEFQFETKINNRDTILEIPYTYFIVK